MIGIVIYANEFFINASAVDFDTLKSVIFKSTENCDWYVFSIEASISINGHYK